MSLHRPRYTPVHHDLYFRFNTEIHGSAPGDSTAADFLRHLMGSPLVREAGRVLPPDRLPCRQEHKEDLAAALGRYQA